MARIAGINIPQNKLVHVALTYIFGIGDKFANVICNDLNIPKSKRVNQLNEDEFFTNSISSVLNESLSDMGWDLKKNILYILIINP